MASRTSPDIKNSAFGHIKSLPLYLWHCFVASEESRQRYLILLKHRGEHSELACLLSFEVVGNRSAHWIHFSVHSVN